MNRIPLVISLIALAAVVALFVHSSSRIEQLEQKLARPSSAPAVDKHAEKHDEVEVADYMTRMQSFNTKLWAAGQASNLPLVEFYLHELEEAMEEIADGDVMDDGVNVSRAMQQIGMSALSTFEQVTREQGLTQFNARYENFVLACNACHQATQHPFIKVRVPTSIRFDEQDFTP